MAHLRCSVSPVSCSRDFPTDLFTADFCQTKFTLSVRGFSINIPGLENSSANVKDHKKRYSVVFSNGFFKCNGLHIKDFRRCVSSSSPPSLESGGIGGNRSGGIYGGNGRDSNNGEGPEWGNSNNGRKFGNGGGLLGLFLQGWKLRVQADPQFSFKVLMEEVVGLSSCLLGDMASRPNFGLNELDFVFSTLVVGSIMNFTLMYMLAPTSAAGGQALPGIFSSCPSSHMFEAGTYSVFDRLGTFIYKGTLFAAVGFAAGLVGTALSNTLINIRTKMDPNSVAPNKPPPPLLNASTWALHMGLSSNFRYQTLNGIEFLAAKELPPVGFKASVVVLRCLNNVLGGMSFVLLARLTGSQKVEKSPPSSLSPEEKLISSANINLVEKEDLQTNQPS
eukprot:Gb_11188 [translate_table: standard]